MLAANAEIIEAKLSSGLYVKPERLKAYRKFKGLPEKPTECPEHQVRLIHGECVKCLKDHNRLLQHDVDFGSQAYEEMKLLRTALENIHKESRDGGTTLAKLMDLIWKEYEKLQKRE